jgi:hypothetical protein
MSRGVEKLFMSVYVKAASRGRRLSCSRERAARIILLCNSGLSGSPSG